MANTEFYMSIIEDDHPEIKNSRAWKELKEITGVLSRHVFEEGCPNWTMREGACHKKDCAFCQEF